MPTILGLLETAARDTICTHGESRDPEDPNSPLLRSSQSSRLVAIVDASRNKLAPGQSVSLVCQTQTAAQDSEAILQPASVGRAK